MRLEICRRVATGLAVVLLGVLPASPSVARNLPENVARTIFYNGKVFTAKPGNFYAEGIVVQNRRVIAVGSTQHVLHFETPQATLVDLEGRTLMPGLNDAHVHPFDMVSFPRAARLNLPDFIPGPGPSLGDALSLVQEGVVDHPKGTWLFVVVGDGVVADPTADRFALDAVAPDHPVLLATWYGHGTFLNSKAMQVLGIGEEEPDPFGGFYERVPGTQVVNGIAHEYAEHQIRRFFAEQTTDEEFVQLFEDFAARAAARGYTSVQEFTIGLAQDRHLSLLAQADLPIRWRALCFPLTLAESCRTPSTSAAHQSSSRLRSGGIKWIVDGTPIERLAFLSEDYADLPGERGRLNLSPMDLRAGLQRSLSGPRQHSQALVHAVGDATASTVLELMDDLAADRKWRRRRPRIEHGDFVRPGEFASARAKGLFVVQNPVHFALVDVFQQRFSASLYLDLEPMRTLLDEGIHLALGSDAVADVGLPFLDLFFAVVHPAQPSEALTIEEAVIAYTHTAAAAEFEERKKGTLAPGKWADLIVLSQDVFTVPPPAIPATQVLLTMVGGEVVYDAGALDFRAATQ